MTNERRATRDSWWRTAPVLTIAVLALIVSTAGGAYAVGKNSIGTKQLKNNAVTSGKIRSSTIQSSDIKNSTIASADLKDGGVAGADVADGSLTARDFAPGQLAPIPAGSSRVYFAKVESDGTLVAKSPGVVSSSLTIGPSASFYTVVLGFDATNCAAVGTSGAPIISTGTLVLGSSVRVSMSYSGAAITSTMDLTVIC